MKQRITANGELDMLTSGELRAELDRIKAWQVELNRGAKLRRHVLQGPVSGGAVAIGDVNDGPAEGMAWAITRVTVAPGPTLAAGGLNMFINDTTSLSALALAALQIGNVFPGDHGLNILSGDSLRVVGTGITVADQVTVVLGIKEVPIQQIWSL